MVRLPETVVLEVCSELRIDLASLGLENFGDLSLEVMVAHLSVLFWDIASLKKLLHELLLEAILDVRDGHLELLQEVV